MNDNEVVVLNTFKGIPEGNMNKELFLENMKVKRGLEYCKY